jgi:hypothetical protein
MNWFKPTPRLSPPISAVQDAMVAYQQQLDRSLDAFTGPDRYSGLAHAIAVWAVRKLGASRASQFADAIVKGVQMASRGQV